MASGVNYTPHQAQAVTSRGQNILVSAAAGSGKTRVLVDRIVGLICSEGVPITEMLIVTFTNAAAREMKERIAKGLEDALQAKGAHVAFIQEQIGLLGQAHISTMHAYCIHLLRQYFHELNINPNFTILHQSAEVILQQESMNEVFTAHYEAGDEAFLRFVDAYGGRRDDGGAVAMVYSVYGFIQSQPNSSEWLAAAIGDEVPQEADFARSRLGKRWLAHLRMSVAELAEQNEALLALCASATGPHHYLPAIEADGALIDGLDEYLIHEDLDGFANALGQVRFARLASLGKAAKEAGLFDEDLEAAAKDGREGFKEGVKKLQKAAKNQSVAAICADAKIAQAYLETLVVLVQDFTTVFQAKKQATGNLDFGDLEHYTIALLAQPGIAEEIRRRLRYIFFDEYQDANAIQEHIIETLKGDNNLFFVGDVKQSIYRFRLADPTLFNARAACYGKGGPDNQKIDLAENFRSRGEILNFCNFLFTGLMSEALGEVDYNHPGQALVCGSDRYTPIDDAVTLALIDLEKDLAEETGSDVEARYIAQKIKALRGTPKADGTLASYRDMVVLLRSPRAALADYEAVFRQENIPYYADISTVSFTHLEVTLFIAMLQTVDNDQQDTPLLATLLSPFGDFTEEELAMIRIGRTEMPFYQALVAYQEMEDDLAEKIQGFYVRLTAMRQVAQTIGLADFGWHFLLTSGYQAYLLAQPEGEAQLANVHAFIEKMAEYERDSNKGLYGFLHYVGNLLREKSDSLSPAVALSEADDVVRIMSVHKSKGLEFPIVFLAALAKKFNKMDLSQRLLTHNSLGLGLKIVDPEVGTIHKSVLWQLISEEKLRELKSEELRLFYVALTRAAERLILVMRSADPARELEKAAKGSLTERGKAAAAYSDWLLAVLVRDHQGRGLCRKFDLEMGGSDHYYKRRGLGASGFVAEVVPASTLVGVEPPVAQEAAFAQWLWAHPVAPSAAIDHVLRYQNYVYPFDAETTKPYKETVSQIAQRNVVADPGLLPWPSHAAEVIDGGPWAVGDRLPRFLQKSHVFTAAEIGTITHLVLQAIPLAPHTHETVADALVDLVKREILMAEEAAVVDQTLVVDFFASPLGLRLLAAGDHVCREQSFTMRYGDTIVDGQIDCYFPDGDGLVLLDFKTDRRPDPSKYHHQMALYKYALEQATGKQVKEVWLYWVRHKKADSLHV